MEIPIFPLNAVLFPGAVLPLHIFEERYKLMISHCLEGDGLFGAVLIRVGSEVGEPAQPFSVGTTARIVHVQKLADARMNIVSVGDQRFRILKLVRTEPYLVARVEMLECEGDGGSLAELADTTASLFAEYYRLFLALSGQWTRTIGMPQEAATVADFVASRLSLSLWAKQRLLETLSVRRRLETEVTILSETIRDLTRRVALTQVQKRYAVAALN
ncbi:MAG: LON peptidase substrate-binding domain-containing protein [Dehalococcoidia bacterium]